MKATVKWVDGMMLVGESGSGHALVMDGAPEVGGRNLGIRPMEMILLGLGGCTSMDVLFILKKARQPIVDCRVEIEAERAESTPKVFTKIHVRYVLTGGDLEPKQVERAVNLSSERYCSVSLMLGKAVALSHDWVIEPAA